MADRWQPRQPAGGRLAGFAQPVRILAAAALGVCCALLTGQSTAAGPVYKWTDENGITHYGQRPPRDTSRAQQIDLPQDRESSGTEAPRYEERLERINRRLEVYEEERRIKEEREAEARQTKARRDQQCARLRAQVRDYETRGGTWYELDEQGNRRYLDDRQLAERIRQFHETIGQHCR